MVQLQIKSKFIILILFLIIKFISSNKIGDIIPLMKRVEYNNVRSEFSEISPTSSPRFGINKSSKLNIYI